MVTGFSSSKDLASARIYFNRMPEKNVVSWSAMLSGYAQNGFAEEAIELFNEMISAGYSALIFMYSKCGSLKDAEKIFQEMQTRDTISYNGHGPAAVDLMSKMKEEGIEPDRITYIGVLTACSHSGLLEEGKKVFESISTPDTDHSACMVDLLGRVGKLDEAKRLVERMPNEPHAGVYGSLLNASQIHRRLDLAEFAAKKLFELEPETSGNYILLSNIYASAGRWRDVERVRQELRIWGVRKTTGWSWVEHSGRMHKFIVGDQ